MKQVHVYFTAEQEQWLRDNYHSVDTYEELTMRFNERFGTSRKKESIREKCCKRLGLKGIISKTTYGNKEKEQLPIGTIRKSQVATYIKVLPVPNGTHFTGYAEPYWLPLQKKIYQDAFGPIDSGKMVCFLDNNPENFELDNLYCIDRRISALMSSNHWWTDSKLHTLTAIKWCELYYVLKAIRTQTN